MAGLVILTFQIRDKDVISTLDKRRVAEAAKSALIAAARIWLEEIMPARFAPGTQNRYTFDPRNQVYLKVLKRIFGRGDGQVALLQLRGRTFRFARFFSKITATSRRAVVRMNLPAYFTNPKTGVVYENGKRKVIRRMPRMSAEVVQTTVDDTRMIDERATKVYQYFFSRSQKDSVPWVTVPEPNNRTVIIR